ncbi:MAG TPA: EAL domain-containing protein [Gammaproteobacteria bacterium]
MSDLRHSRIRRTYSLRARYLAATTLVALIIVTGALLASSYTERVSAERRHTLELRNEALRHIRLLRLSILDVERDLNGYLWQSNTMRREHLRDSFHRVITHQKVLYDLTWFKSANMTTELNNFGRDLEGLGIALDNFIASRPHSAGATLASPPRREADISQALAVSAELQFAHLWESLQRLDEKLEVLAAADIVQLSESATTTVRILWGLALLGLAVLATGAIYFQRSILAPITQVTHALRAVAHGEAADTLPKAQSRETHHLIDAFGEMVQQVQLRQQSLEHLALHDTLTGLANREQLTRAIAQTLGKETPPRQELALLLIGLNRFREINNSLGHHVGDRLLVAVAERLRTTLATSVMIARLNGDEFALLLCGEQSANADLLANELIKTLESPFEVESQSLYLSATIGIALSPEHGMSPQELLQKAEVAMGVAKRHKLPVTHYSTEHDRHAKRRLDLANALRHELHAPLNSLTLAYQPQVEIRTGRFCGVEALLRWEVGDEGMVSAEELIPIAENTGLIYQLTPWVLERAFEEFSSLKCPHPIKPVLSANLSVLNLHDVEFPRRLKQLMEKWAIDPALLQLEITESAMMADPSRAQRTLAQIHAMGVELAIDDFGTGFSSLAYLKHLPVSKLKIDKSFVMSMLHDENDAVIIRSTIDMAHNMGLWVVAEGVEKQETFDLLEILDCDIAQGYLISAPLDITALEQWSDGHAMRTTSPRPTLAGC